MALVLYNAALAVAQQAGPWVNPVLLVGQQQLAPYVHNAAQRAVLALPGLDVEIVRGSMSPQQVASHRPSYINAILIQSRGVAAGRCAACAADRPGLRPFPLCLRVPGHFGGACANCKWRDHAGRCTVRDDGGGDNGGTGGQGRAALPPGNPGNDAGAGALVVAGASVNNPIVL